MQWVAGGGSIKNPSGQCLAARGEYMPAAKGIAGIQIWAKPLGGGKTAALFINGAPPLQNGLFTPEFQWKSRGK
jgi:hypothetical protein